MCIAIVLAIHKLTDEIMKNIIMLHIFIGI
jgi:hypothetical protein